MRILSRTARTASLVLGFALAVPAGVTVAPVAAIARPAPDSFADLAAKLLPAVVNVSSTTNIKQAAGNVPGGPDMPVFPPGSPFEQFFKDFLNRGRPGGPHGDAPAAPHPKSQSLGSGFIIDSSGLVVTNNHVIDGADEVSVILQDNTILKAEVVGKDESGDLALLRVKTDKPLPTVAFGDSDASRIGDWVLAIGNPFGFGGTVTAGIVSARGRSIGGTYDDFIQTDAAINKGNSGGPLFNMSGEVIGINTAIISPQGGSVGIGFSIPSNMAKNIVMQLKDFGHPRRGWLGVRIQTVTPELAESVGLKDALGAMVAGVTDGGPAEKSKFKGGDIILRFDGKDVKDMHALPKLVAETEVGKKVDVVVWRDGKEVTLPAVLDEKPSDDKLASADSKPTSPNTAPSESRALAGLGLTVAPITDESRQKYRLGDDQKGVVITDVEQNGVAAERGLKPGDVIVEVQQAEVGSPDDLAKKIEAQRSQDRKSVLMLIQGQDGERYVPLPLSKGKASKPG